MNAKNPSWEKERKKAAITARANRVSDEVGEYMLAVADNKSPEELEVVRDQIAARIQNIQDREFFLEQCLVSNILSAFFNDRI